MSKKRPAKKTRGSKSVKLAARNKRLAGVRKLRATGHGHGGKGKLKAITLKSLSLPISPYSDYKRKKKRAKKK